MQIQKVTWPLFHLLQTSPTTYSIVGTSNKALVALIGVTIMNDSVTPKGILFIALSLVGSSIYALSGKGKSGAETKLQSIEKSDEAGMAMSSSEDEAYDMANPSSSRQDADVWIKNGSISTSNLENTADGHFVVYRIALTIVFLHIILNIRLVYIIRWTIFCIHHNQSNTSNVNVF